MKKYLTGLFTLLMLGSANATVIDFSSGTGSNTYTEGDYTFTAPGNQYANGTLDFHSHAYSQAPTVLTSSSGLFDFLSFDFRQNVSHENLTISNNLGASMYFAYADYSSWNSIVLGSGWNNLTSVSFKSNSKYFSTFSLSCFS